MKELGGKYVRIPLNLHLALYQGCSGISQPISHARLMLDTLFLSRLLFGPVSTTGIPVKHTKPCKFPLLPSDLLEPLLTPKPSLKGTQSPGLMNKPLVD